MSVKPIVRTTAGLRKALIEEMDALRSGESTPYRAAIFAKLAVQVINTLAIDIEYQKHMEALPNGEEKKTYTLALTE